MSACACVNHPERLAVATDGFLPPLCPECVNGPLPEDWPASSELATAVADATEEPIVVVLCGSTRFMAQLARAARQETVAGRIVLRPECDLRRPDALWPPPRVEEIKAGLDELHRAKIRLADEVLVVAPGGYIGPSTRAEIDYAGETGRPVRYWRPAATCPAPGVPAGVVADTWWWLICEDCGASALDSDDGDSCGFGLAQTPEEAAQQASGSDPDWSIHAGVSRCPECAQRVCAGTGHVWSTWWETAFHPRVPRHVGRDCQRCGQCEYAGQTEVAPGGEQ